MKAAGMSAHQVLAPLLLTALAVSVTSFIFNEAVVARSTARLEAWSNANYGPIPPQSRIRNNVYLADGPNILAARTVIGTGDSMTMQDVTFYRRDKDEMIDEQIRSPRATYAKPGWRLENPRGFNVEQASSGPLAPLVVAKGLTPAKVAISGVDADSENVVELRRSIDLLSGAGRRTAELSSKWWHKFSGPLSAVLMPLLGAVAGFGLARSGQLFVRAVIGMALGFAYFVVDNAALAMGNFGGYPPLLAAWAPFFLFLLVGEMVLIRTEE
jgi:lipopolysaccharide export system permease protein